MGKIFSIFLFFVSAIFCSGSLMAADTIKLGVAGAHSGDMASYGIPSVQLVVEAVNAKGGILGIRKNMVNFIRLIYCYKCRR